MFLTIASAASPLSAFMASVFGLAMAMSPARVAASEDEEASGSVPASEEELESSHEDFDTTQLAISGVSALIAGGVEYMTLLKVDNPLYGVSGLFFAAIVLVVVSEVGVFRNYKSAMYSATVGLPAVALATSVSSWATSKEEEPEPEPEPRPVPPRPEDRSTDDRIKLLPDSKSAEYQRSPLKYFSDFSKALAELVKYQKDTLLTDTQQKALLEKLNLLRDYVKATIDSSKLEVASVGVSAKIKPHVKAAQEMVDVLSGWNKKTLRFIASDSADDVVIQPVREALDAVKAGLPVLQQRLCEIGGEMFVRKDVLEYQKLDELFDALVDGHLYATQHKDAAVKQNAKAKLAAIKDRIMDFPEFGVKVALQISKDTAKRSKALKAVQHLLLKLSQSAVLAIKNSDAGITGGDADEFIFAQELKSLRDLESALQLPSLDEAVAALPKFDAEKPNLLQLVPDLIALNKRITSVADDKAKVYAAIKVAIEPVLKHIADCKTAAEDKKDSVEEMYRALYDAKAFFPKLPTNAEINPDNKIGTDTDYILNEDAIRALAVHRLDTIKDDQVDAVLSKVDSMKDSQNVYDVHNYIKQLVAVYETKADKKDKAVENLKIMTETFVKACRNPSSALLSFAESYNIQLFASINKVLRYLGGVAALGDQVKEVKRLYDEIFPQEFKRAKVFFFGPQYKLHLGKIFLDKRVRIADFLVHLNKMGVPSSAEKLVEKELEDLAAEFYELSKDEPGFTKLDDEKALVELKKFINLSVGATKLYPLFVKSESAISERIAKP